MRREALNEDYVGVMPGELEPRPVRGSAIVFADGIRGRGGGRVAAELAVPGFAEAWLVGAGDVQLNPPRDGTLTRTGRDDSVPVMVGAYVGQAVGLPEALVTNVERVVVRRDAPEAGAVTAVRAACRLGLAFLVARIIGRFIAQRALEDRLLERGQLLVGGRPVQRPGHQLLDQRRGKVHPLARFHRHFFLAFAWRG
ncbi:hypothetical protein DF048_02315 [Burkholderia seminalis]|nr:hypothetical protein [Burkholderia seminalis]RQT01099.1 hypothetical protein DF048_02315 [Burkholderia seminalis]